MEPPSGRHRQRPVCQLEVEGGQAAEMKVGSYW
jgi:hypothetical protein